MNPTMKFHNFKPRVRPNFKIRHELLTPSLKSLSLYMKNLGYATSTEIINDIIEREFLDYDNFRNPSLTHFRLPIADAFRCLQETSNYIASWGLNEWNLKQKQLEAQSILEASFDVIFNVWHLFEAQSAETRETFEKEVFQLDFLYRRMLSICFLTHLKSPLQKLGIHNPLANSSVSSSQNSIGVNCSTLR